MYASLPLSWPSRVVCARPAAFGDAEVEHAGDAVDADEDVLRRDVAVDDVERVAALVAGPRGPRAAPEGRPRGCAAAIAQRDPLAAVADGAREASERLALDVLHDEKELALAKPRRRASGRRSGAGCARRAAPRRGTSRRTRGPWRTAGCSRLIATVREKPTGAREAAQVHRGHPAGRDLVEERVPAEDAEGRRGLGRHSKKPTTTAGSTSAGPSARSRQRSQ